MKANFLFWIILIALSSMMFQGYQCGSTEMTSAKLYIQQKNYDAAIKNLEGEVQKNPGNEEAWYLLGGLKADKMDYTGMNFAFQQALKLYNKWGVHLNNGVSYLERASADSTMLFEKSLEEFQKANLAWPDTSLTYRYLGYAYNNKADYPNAVKAFNEAWERGKDVESLKRAGRIYLQWAYDHKSKFEADNAGKLKTLKDLDEVKKGSSKNDVMRTLGAPDDVKKGARGTKKEEWTYKNYSMKLSMDGDKVTGKTFTSPYKSTVDSTESILAMKEFGNAIHALERVKDADPADNDNLNFLLRAYVESGKIKEAIKTYQLASKNDPNNKQVHYILGVLYRTDGDFNKSISEFETAQTIDPNFTDAIFDLGATYYNWGVDIIKAANEKGEDTEEFKDK
ncbi:MAG: hypothetical protein HW374_2151, partial [Bacteroidetes bacterium]|nr:hypothetical protein [Bacteroidota bacterium]